jgi:hypothetical protein
MAATAAIGGLLMVAVRFAPERSPAPPPVAVHVADEQAASPLS